MVIWPLSAEPTLLIRERILGSGPWWLISMEK
jgi:hypothetical protein